MFTREQLLSLLAPLPEKPALARLEAEVAIAAFPMFKVLNVKHKKSLMFRGCSRINVALV